MFQANHGEKAWRRAGYSVLIFPSHIRKDGSVSKRVQHWVAVITPNGFVDPTTSATGRVVLEGWGTRRQAMKVADEWIDRRLDILRRCPA